MGNLDNQTAVNRCLQKGTTLLEYGMDKLGYLPPFNPYNATCSREEYCTNSSLHRGIYHPSPIIDLLIGNTKRGSLKKQFPHNHQFTHRYMYNDGILMCIETYFQSKVAYTEYLYYDQKQRYGVTIDNEMRLAAVTEEIFDADHIVAFSLMNCVLLGGKYKCIDLRSENYYYDSEGLVECDMQKLSPMGMTVINEHYIWEREAGYLTAYTNISCLHEHRKYPVKKRRSAQISLEMMRMPQLSD